MTGNIPEAKPARAEASGDGASSQWPAGPRIILAPPQTARCRVAFHSAQPELQSTPVPYDAECAHGLPVAGVFEEVRTAMQLAFALIGPSLRAPKHPVSCRREKGGAKTGGAGCAQLGVAGQVLAGEQQLDRAGAAGVVARQGPRLPHAAAQPVVAVVRGKSSAIVLHLPKVARQKWSEPAGKHMAGRVRLPRSISCEPRGSSAAAVTYSGLAPRYATL